MTATMFDSPCNCLALRQAARHVTQRYDEALAPCGLRVTQYSILVLLKRTGPASVQQLADELVMDRSTLGHNLRPLERDRLVALQVDPNDRRARRLLLTPLGETKLAEARPLWKAAQARFERGYGKPAADELRALLRRVVTEASA